MDEQCIGVKASQVQGHCVEQNDRLLPIEEQVAAFRDEDEQMESMDVHNETGNNTSLKRQADEFREWLAKLRSLSYLVQSADSLSCCTSELKKVHDRLIVSCPVSEGLLMENEASCSKIKSLDANKPPRDLPTRKKKPGIAFNFNNAKENHVDRL